MPPGLCTSFILLSRAPNHKWLNLSSIILILEVVLNSVIIKTNICVVMTEILKHYIKMIEISDTDFFTAKIRKLRQKKNVTSAICIEIC